MPENQSGIRVDERLHPTIDIFTLFDSFGEGIQLCLAWILHSGPIGYSAKLHVDFAKSIVHGIVCRAVLIAEFIPLVVGSHTALLLLRNIHRSSDGLPRLLGALSSQHLAKNCIMRQNETIQLADVKRAKEKKRHADMVLAAWDDQQHQRDRQQHEQRTEVERKARSKL
ncbi:hypothetical protein PCO31111_04528 [Pandoraea communis]|uniref:Uncharacterized protein n=2 Tax=Burkholderiaceae TaxID=119060 RepID=A0A5E4YGP9_9BURK|nr:hypothetical protein PCO31111_04528 [Pandoraea communis]